MRAGAAAAAPEPGTAGMAWQMWHLVDAIAWQMWTLMFFDVDHIFL